MNHSTARKLIYCITLFLFCNLKLAAFPKNDYSSDTLTVTERLQLEKATRNSFLGYYELADSFSKRRDSVNASKLLLKIDPYYFFYINQTPESIDHFLSTQFKLIDSIQRQYVQLFDSLYNAPKSDSYDTFKRMHEEDQQIRNILDKANDSFTYAKEEQRMRSTDSIHTNYLCNYLSKYGWPTIRNGSFYATLLAIHGHEHYNFYVPFMKRAILSGNSFLSALDLILYWKKDESTFANLKKIIATPKKAVFDVGSMLNYQLPSSLDRIEKVVKSHCPIRLYLVYESPTNEQFKGWFAKMHDRNNENENGVIIQQLFDDLQIDCPKSLIKGIWDIWYLPSDRTRMILYVIYN